MCKVKLFERDSVMEVEEYMLTYPFNLLSNNDNETYYNLNSFEYKNIKGSFHVMFCKKIDFSGFTNDGEKKMLKIEKLLIFEIHIQKIIQLFNFFYLYKDNFL